MTDPVPRLGRAKGEPKTARKSPEVSALVDQALEILSDLGIPVHDLTQRRKERAAGAFLAVADVSSSEGWPAAKELRPGRSLKTRDIIAWENEHLGEEISPGSYDDIRREDLRLLVLAGIVVPTAENAARNDPTRGYALSREHAALVRTFGQPGWDDRVTDFMAGRPSLAEALARKRPVQRVPVVLPGGRAVEFSPGKHNLLQKAIVDEFLPRFGFGAEILYIGDAANKFLVFEESRLSQLGFFELAHGELPDVLAFSPSKNWLFLIEAVHTSGPMSETRLLRLNQLTRNCTAGLVYVSAFSDVTTFRRFSADIAWETEVWIASRPDHLIHFNGDKFLGPYASRATGPG